jgi:uncharacterized membrane-anchored protein YitT (DUF2179 family)
MFTETQHTILFCTISRSQERDVRTAVLRIDPNAFIVIGQGHQASGGVLGASRRDRNKPTPYRRTP